MTVQTDGKIVWAANTQAQDGADTNFAVARFTPDGQLDSTFGSGGRVTTELLASPTNAIELADAVLVQPDGKVIVGGSTLQGGYRSSVTTGALVRYNRDGSLDASFGNGGKALSTAVGNVRSLGLDATGDIFVLPGRAEFSPTGRLDASVTSAPITASSRGGPDTFLANGASLIGTAVGVVKGDVDPHVQRFNASGSVDPTFTNAPFDYTGVEGGGREGVGAIAIQPNGATVVGGSHFFSTSVFGLARVNTSGSLDATFGHAGTLTTSFQGNEAVAALLLQPDGKIVAVGYSQNNATGEADIALARYLG
jgi:uncharacterized delta-60 repeat protein